MAGTDEIEIPWEQNDRAKRVLERLERGPASTVELQNGLHLSHVARQIWELRKWYGWTIKTRRTGPSRTAVYELVGKTEVDPPKSPLCPKCNAPLRDIRQTLAGGWIDGRCLTHGRTKLRLA